MQYEVRKVPLPSRSGGGRPQSEMVTQLLALKSDEALFVKVEGDKVKAHRALSSRLRGITKKYGVAFTTRVRDGEIGVWRKPQQEEA